MSAVTSKSTAAGATKASDPRDTPAMRQYARFKAAHPGCVLMFRIGDFYEMFDEDAVFVSKAIGLTLTQRTAGVPMCGVPFHQLEPYLKRMVAQGMRVAVCEQIEDVEDAKARGSGAIVERGVTRVMTPGTLVDESLLAEDEANVLAGVWTEEGRVASGESRMGPTEDSGPRTQDQGPRTQDSGPRIQDPGRPLAYLAVAELSTGAFTVLSCPVDQVESELVRRRVREVVFAQHDQLNLPPWATRAKAMGVALSPQAPWHFRKAEAAEALKQQFGVATLAGFGLGDDDPLALAAGAVVRYLRATLGGATNGDATVREREPHLTQERSLTVASLSHLQPPRREDATGTLLIDGASLRALEIDRTLRGAAGAQPASAGPDGSLLGIFSGARVGAGQCRTAMGKRLLREWLVRPLAERGAIEARQGAVSALVEDRRVAGELGKALDGVQDVARIGARVAMRRCTPRDLVALGASLARVDALRDATTATPALASWHTTLGAGGVAANLRPIAEKIASQCRPDAPAHLRDGGLIVDGVDAELDEARQLSTNAGAWLATYQSELVAAHGLPNLKVGYNKIFGYYIELPKAQAAKAPPTFSRRQTLTGAERYITPELKEYEEKVTTAEKRAKVREQAMFDALCAVAGGALADIARFGLCAAELDVLLSLADKAQARRWVRPTIVDEPVLNITQGRHPVLDELLEGSFVPNDLALGAANTNAAGGTSARLALITGPNMAGKSTFIRQTALIVLLAHVGGFVPAEAATIGLTDRLFTRIGADDALHAGQSTFMVEMVETAGILHHATSRSLVVLDEIGRGTSTLDGLSLAWAIAERLAGEGNPERQRAGRVGKRGSSGPVNTPNEGHKSSAGGSATGPRTLFATHYHELTKLEELLPGRVTNLQVAVREWGEQIVFLHRIVPGRADKSYGLHVAKLAGIPAEVVKRAGAVLETLSVEHAAGAPATSPARPREADQPSLFTQTQPHPAVDRLRELAIESMSPLEAFDELRRLKDSTTK